MRLGFDFFHAPDLFTVHDEMTELMRAIKTGSCPVSFIAAQHHHWVIGKWQRGCIDIGAVERQPSDDNTM